MIFQLNTVQCRYNAVNFPENIHNRQTKAHPWGKVGSVFSETKLWFIFFVSQVNAVVCEISGDNWPRQDDTWVVYRFDVWQAPRKQL